MENELGYYTVNGVNYSNKIQAILEAQRTLTNFTWNYYAEKLNTVNWQEEPQLSLNELYKLRAQQIRDRYDYVICMCSGGADSANIVRTFLNNGIHVDEIVSGAPLSGLNNYNFTDKDNSVTNTASETKYALYPLLNEIAMKFPKVKITFNDYFENIKNYKTDEWLYSCQDWISVDKPAKGRLDKFKHIVNLAEQGKRIGVIWGVDKPQLRYGADGSIYTLLTDFAVNGVDAPFDKNYPNVDIVLFYWSPDLPELMIKQSHVVAKFIHKKENTWLINQVKHLGSGNPLFYKINTTKDPLAKSNYQRGIVPAIYGNNVNNVFQCHKSTKTFIYQGEDWFYQLHKDTYLHQQIMSDYNLFCKSINSKYLATDIRGNIIGFKGFIQTYRIGHYTQFMDCA
jgi:hypothetical protein